MGDEVVEDGAGKSPSPAKPSPLENEMTAIHAMIALLDGLPPIAAKRVVDFVVTHHQERLANLMAQQRQRQRLENESVAQ